MSSSIEVVFATHRLHGDAVKLSGDGNRLDYYHQSLPVRLTVLARQRLISRRLMTQNLLGFNSTVLIVILVFVVFFSLLFASQSIAAAKSNPQKGFKSMPYISEDAAIDIAMKDLEKKIAPLRLDKYVETQRYFESSLSLIFVHDNGTVYEVVGNTFHQPCDPAPCDIVGGKEPVRGHLFYDVNGSWQDSSVGNCSDFLYAIDAESGDILSSSFEGPEDAHCVVKPPGW